MTHGTAAADPHIIDQRDGDVDKVGAVLWRALPSLAKFPTKADVGVSALNPVEVDGRIHAPVTSFGAGCCPQ